MTRQLTPEQLSQLAQYYQSLPPYDLSAASGPATPNVNQPAAPAPAPTAPTAPAAPAPPAAGSSGGADLGRRPSTEDFLYWEMQEDHFSGRSLNHLLNYYDETMAPWERRTALARSAAFFTAAGGQWRRGDILPAIWNYAVGALDAVGSTILGDTPAETARNVATGMVLGGGVKILSGFSRAAALTGAVGTAATRFSGTATNVPSSRVLLVGAENELEFANAQELQARGNDVTVVNPARSEAAQAFQANGGTFVQGNVQDLPGQYDFVHENFPQPILPNTPVGIAEAQARINVLAPGGRLTVITENPDLANTYRIAAQLEGVSFSQSSFPGPLPTSSWVGESATRYLLLLTRPQ
jgi:hypothetical protein